MTTLGAIAKLLCNEPPTLESVAFAPGDTVLEVLARLEGACEPPGNLAMLHAGVELGRERTMRDCGVSAGAVLHVIARRRSLRLHPPPATNCRSAAAGPVLPSGIAHASADHGLWRDAGTSGSTSRHVPSLEEVVAPTTLRSCLAPPPPPSLSTWDATDEPDCASSDGDVYEQEPTQYGAETAGLLNRSAADALTHRPPAPLPPTSGTSSRAAVGASAASTSFVFDDRVPLDRLQLQWAVGLTPGAGALVLGTGEVVYAAGRICVVHHPTASLQRHFCGHARRGKAEMGAGGGGFNGGAGGAIRCLALHPFGRLVASSAPWDGADDGGGGCDEVCVWDGWTCELLCTFRCGGAFRMSFSPDGEGLACLSRAFRHENRQHSAEYRQPTTENRQHSAEIRSQGGARIDTWTASAPSPTRAWHSASGARQAGRAAPPSQYGRGAQAGDGRGVHGGIAREFVPPSSDSSGQQISIWSWRRAERTHVFPAEGGPFRDLSWMPAARHGGVVGGAGSTGSGCGGGRWGADGGGFGSARDVDVPRLVVLGRRTLVFFSVGSAASSGGASPCPSAEAAGHGEAGPPAGRLRTLLILGGGLLVTGSTGGEVQLWSAATLMRRTQAHAGAVRDIVACGGAEVISGGGGSGGVRTGGGGGVGGGGGGSRGFASAGDDGLVVLWSDGEFCCCGLGGPVA
jgi:hypothetical protein